MSLPSLVPPAQAHSLPWVVVVPVKPFARAKSRLGPDIDSRRAALARAFAADTVAAVRAVQAVRLVVVVTGDRAAREALRGPGIHLLGEPTPAGLNAAASTGIAWVRRHHPDAAVAVVTADLPALRAEDAATVLRLAAEHPRAVVADREGTGSTVLTAWPGEPLQPLFGPDSMQRHRRDGAVRLHESELVRAARDVDTATQLAEAVRLGVGQATARVLAD